MKCLLTDDSRVNQIVGSQVLKSLGHQVTLASNGQEAAEEVSEKFYDVVFMDCQMPVMNGFEATEAIRMLPNSHFNFNVPVIALTGHESSVNLSKCILCGMNSRLRKPVNVDELKTLLNKLTPQVEARRRKYQQNHNLSQSVVP